MAKNGKRMKKAIEGIDRESDYALAEAVKMVKERATTKFDETVEISINLHVDPRHADQMVRGVISLPHGTGKSVRVAVFAKGDKAKEAEDAGADLVGAEDLAEKVQGGEIDFDRCVATPDMMAVVGRLGKVLGPRGLMPNPKLGTVTADVAAAVQAVKGGQVEYRCEKAGIIHAGVGNDTNAPQHPRYLLHVGFLLPALVFVPLLRGPVQFTQHVLDLHCHESRRGISAHGLVWAGDDIAADVNRIGKRRGDG